MIEEAEHLLTISEIKSVMQLNELQDNFHSLRFICRWETAVFMAPKNAPKALKG